jgi:arylsulfatase A-like enzyme
MYNRREFLKAVGGGAASLALFGGATGLAASSSKTPKNRPNIILIMADDLGYGDIGCYGSQIIQTPNLDALAENGMRFTDFHSNGAMCSPTRAALLTGRYQQRAGIESVLSCKSSYETGMAPDEVTFAEVLKGAGYATACFGKWHLGYTLSFGPIAQGFDTYRGHVAGGSDYFSHVDRSGRPDWWKDTELEPEQGYTTDLITKHAIRFIEKNRSKPLCVYLPYQAVHFPFQGPNDQADRVVGGNYWSKAKYGRRYEDVEDRKAAYREIIEALDAGVGRIVEAVRRLGLEKKTLIFFTSDNGAYRWVGSNLPCRGQKSDLWEGGHRVPAIAYWPGQIAPGTVSGETILTMDLFPTMAAMAGAKLPDRLKLDGVSILPVLLEGRKLGERVVFWRTKSEAAVRFGPWKLLTRSKKQARYEFVGLFNLDDDISEQNNLAEAKPQMVEAFKTKLALWEKEVTTGAKRIRKKS